LGFRSPSRHRCVESTLWRVSQARLCFALSIPTALGDLLLHRPGGPISSHHHVRDSTSGVFPGNQSSCLSASRTLLSLAPPSSASPSGSCSNCRSVASTRSGVFKCSLDPLLRFRFFGFFSEHLEGAFTPSPLMALPSTPHSRVDDGLQRINRCSAFPPVPREFYPSEICDLPLCSHVQRGPTNSLQGFSPAISRVAFRQAVPSCR